METPDTSSAAPTTEGAVMTLEFRALKILAGLTPNARSAAANWLLALNEADACEQVKRDLRNAKRRAARRRKVAA